MTVLYPNLCYNEVCFKVTALYFGQRSHRVVTLSKTHLSLLIVLVQPRKIHPNISEKLLTRT